MAPAQVVLRWNLQQGVLVAPKCTSEDHAKEIQSTSMLNPEEMKDIDSIEKGKRFVAPPFMYGTAQFCWGKQMPRN